MNIQQLRHFVALVEQGSFTRAAVASHLTQPAFSRSIAQLENDLNVSLIDRIGKKFELTSYGNVVLDHAKSILFETDELYRSIKLQQEGTSGKIRIGLGTTPSALITEHLLSHLTKLSPNLNLLIMHGSIPQQLEALRNHTLDMLVVEIKGVKPTPDLSIEPLPILRSGFLAAKNHKLAQKKNLKFDDVLPWSLVTTLLSPEQVSMMMTFYGSHAHPDECVAFQSDSINELLRIVETTKMIYYGVIAPAHSALENRSLIELPVHPVFSLAQFSIVRLAKRSLPPTFPSIRELICSSMEKWSQL